MDAKRVYAIFILFFIRIYTVLSSAPCDVQMWYLNMQVSNRFPQVLNDEQKKVKRLIETIVKYGDGKATFDCEILKSYEQLFEQDNAEVASDASPTVIDQTHDDVIFVSDLKKKESVPEKNLKSNQEKIFSEDRAEKSSEPQDDKGNKSGGEGKVSASHFELCMRCDHRNVSHAFSYIFSIASVQPSGMSMENNQSRTPSGVDKKGNHSTLFSGGDVVSNQFVGLNTNKTDDGRKRTEVERTHVHRVRDVVNRCGICSRENSSNAFCYHFLFAFNFLVSKSDVLSETTLAKRRHGWMWICQGMCFADTNENSTFSFCHYFLGLPCKAPTLPTNVLKKVLSYEWLCLGFCFKGKRSASYYFCHVFISERSSHVVEDNFSGNVFTSCFLCQPSNVSLAVCGFMNILSLHVSESENKVENVNLQFYSGMLCNNVCLKGNSRTCRFFCYMFYPSRNVRKVAPRDGNWFRKCYTCLSSFKSIPICQFVYIADKTVVSSQVKRTQNWTAVCFKCSRRYECYLMCYYFIFRGAIANVDEVNLQKDKNSVVDECSQCRTKRERHFSYQRCYYVLLVQKKPKKSVSTEPSLGTTFSFKTNVTRQCKFSVLKRRSFFGTCLYLQLWQKKCPSTGQDNGVPAPPVGDALESLKNKHSSAGESKTDAKTMLPEAKETDNEVVTAETITTQKEKLVENADALVKANELLKRKNLEYAAKMATLETQVVRLENMILQKQLLKETDSSAVIKMENQLLKLEKELIRVSQEYDRLKFENERLNQKQTQLTVRQDKTTSQHRYEVETLNSYQARLNELSDHVKKQTNQMMLLNAKTSLLEKHNLVLQEMVLNQSQVIASLTGQVENIVQKRIREEMEKAMREAFERSLGAKQQADSPTVTVCGVTDGQKENDVVEAPGTHEKKETLSKAGPLWQEQEATDTVSDHTLDKTEGSKVVVGESSNGEQNHQELPPQKIQHKQQQQEKRQEQREQQQLQNAKRAPNQQKNLSKEQKAPQHRHQTQKSQANQQTPADNQNRVKDSEQGPVKQENQQHADGAKQKQKQHQDSHELLQQDRKTKNQAQPIEQAEESAGSKTHKHPKKHSQDQQQRKMQQSSQHQQRQQQQKAGQKQQLKQQEESAHAQNQDKDRNQEQEQTKQETKTKSSKKTKVVEESLVRDEAKTIKKTSVKTQKKAAKKAVSEKAVFPEVPLYHNAKREKPKDCYDVFLSGRKRDSAFEITIHNGQTIRVFCDMKNGGWTVIQRRTEGTTDFARSWSEYKEGFGGSLGDHWLGNDNIHYITNSDDYRLRIELTSWNRENFYAEYSRFRIENEEGGYRLHLQGYQGNAGDAMSKHNLEKFSTYDRDNDKAEKEFDGSCAKRFSAGWWYYKCYKANLNGKYYKKGAVEEGRFDGISWKPLKPPTYSFKKVIMKIIPREAIAS